MNAHRRGVPTVSLDESGTAAESMTAAPDQIEMLLAAERRQQMERLVARLAPKLREAIWLRFAGELEYREIAAIVDRPEETVRSRVFQALRRLRDLIGPGGHHDRSWK